eukprot:COSAG06_NODE_3965_length_4711_cov_3.590072_3_plen_211_part_00
MCPGLGTKIRRVIWPCSADDDAAARRLGWCCCWGAALRLAGRAAGSHACWARSGGSRVAGGYGKPVRRCGGGKSPATEGALSEDPHSGQVVRAERLGGRRRHSGRAFGCGHSGSVPLHDSVLKQNHVAARVNRLLHDSLGSRGDFQNACFLRFVSPRFCLQSLSFVILRSSPFASSPSLAAYSLLVPHSFSIPSFVRNLGKFSNSIPLCI